MANLPDEEVNVKMSICKKCTGWVRAAIEHQMTSKSKKDFFKEVIKYDLDVNTVPLLDFRSNQVKYCNCN